MADQQQQMKFRVVDSPNTPELYANRLVSASFDGGTIAVTLGAVRFVPDVVGEAAKDPPVPTLHVTARLAISPSAAVELINTVSKILSSVARPAAPTAAAANPVNPN